MTIYLLVLLLVGYVQGLSTSGQLDLGLLTNDKVGICAAYIGDLHAYYSTIWNQSAAISRIDLGLFEITDTVPMLRNLTTTPAGCTSDAKGTIFMTDTSGYLFKFNSTSMKMVKFLDMEEATPWGFTLLLDSAGQNLYITHKDVMVKVDAETLSYGVFAKYGAENDHVITMTLDPTEQYIYLGFGSPFNTSLGTLSGKLLKVQTTNFTVMSQLVISELGAPVSAAALYDNTLVVATQTFQEEPFKADAAGILRSVDLSSFTLSSNSLTLDFHSYISGLAVDSKRKKVYASTLENFLVVDENLKLEANLQVIPPLPQTYQNRLFRSLLLSPDGKIALMLAGNSNLYKIAVVTTRSGLPWWGILLVVLAVLAVVGGVVVAVVLAIRRRRKQYHELK